MRRPSVNIPMEGEEEKKEWNLGTTANSRCFEIETWSYVQHKDYVLHFLHKPEKYPKNRPRIKTTESQRLAYIRGISTSPFRLQIIYIQQMNFTAFFWLFVENTLFKSIPMNYIHVFLAAYSPDEHMYASKMYPLLTGVSVQVALCGLLQLVACADLLGLYLHYGIAGFLNQSPWNKCNARTVQVQPATYSYKCYDMNEFLNISSTFTFGEIVKGYQMGFYANHYVITSVADNDSVVEIFTGAPMSYFLRHYSTLSVLQTGRSPFLYYVMFVWVIGGVFYKQVYRQYLWKLMCRLQLVMNFIFLVATLYVMYVFLEDVDEHHDHHEIHMPTALDTGLDWDLDMLGDSNTGPPIVQMLYSRSTDKINPGRDSTLITISNSIMYLFKSLTNHQLKHFVEDSAKMPILFSWFNEYPIFYFWPLFFHYVLFGDIAMRLFFLLTFFLELLLFVITYQLLIEVVVCEWAFAPRMISSMVLSMLGFTLSGLLSIEAKRYLYIYSVLIASVTEAVVLFWLYPLARLKDDIHFHTGTRPPFLRVLSLGLVPFYYLYKLLRFFNGIKRVESMKAMFSQSVGMDMAVTKWVWVVPVLPLVLGAFYAVIKYVIKAKQKCNVLLKPRPDWGPRDHVTRQLRKQFDTRDYVASQASRYLSRHLITKAQTTVYKLDTRYDFGGRRSTIFAGFNPRSS